MDCNIDSIEVFRDDSTDGCQVDCWPIAESFVNYHNAHAQHGMIQANQVSPSAHAESSGPGIFGLTPRSRESPRRGTCPALAGLLPAFLLFALWGATVWQGRGSGNEVGEQAMPPPAPSSSNVTLEAPLPSLPSLPAP